MSYQRVIPRDFFNEAKLLKCMGVLALKIHEYRVPEGIKIKIVESGYGFKIRLLDEGALTITTYPVFVNGVRVLMKTSYNSKLPYPLLCELYGEETYVFDDNGDFHKDFIERFTTRQQKTCKTCKQKKDLDDFWYTANNKDRRYNKCKVCYNLAKNNDQETNSILHTR